MILSDIYVSQRSHIGTYMYIITVYITLLFREKCNATWECVVVFIDSKQIDVNTILLMVWSLTSGSIYQRSI